MTAQIIAFQRRETEDEQVTRRLAAVLTIMELEDLLILRLLRDTAAKIGWTLPAAAAEAPVKMAAELVQLAGRIQAAADRRATPQPATPQRTPIRRRTKRSGAAPQPAA